MIDHMLDFTNISEFNLFFESSGFSIQDNISAIKIDKTRGMKSANGLLS